MSNNTQNLYMKIFRALNKLTLNQKLKIILQLNNNVFQIVEYGIQLAQNHIHKKLFFLDNFLDIQKLY